MPRESCPLCGTSQVTIRPRNRAAELDATPPAGAKGAEAPSASYASGEAVAEVNDLNGEGLTYIDFIGEGHKLPVGTKLYAAPTPLPEAVRELVEELDRYLDGCLDPAFVRPDWLINKPSRLLWKCRAALRAILAQA